jgi:hypothetical protein
VGLDPNSADAYHERGLSRMGAEGRREGGGRFHADHRVRPLRAEAYRQRSDAYARLNQPKAAAATAPSALELSVPQPDRDARGGPVRLTGRFVGVPA